MITNLNNIPQNISGIYKITYDNDKIYIGQATNIHKRGLEHNSKNKQICDQALKYHSAIIEVLEEVDDINKLNELESYYIQKYNSTNRTKGYNIMAKGNISGKRGTEHINAAFTEKTLQEVIDLLLYHPEFSLKDIANQYNVEQNTILRISKGHSYYNPNLNYPLRCNDHSSTQKNNILDYFSSEEELLLCKEDLLYRWDLSIEFIQKKYNLPIRVIRDINQGRKFEDIGNFTYPIRERMGKNNLSISKVEQLLNELKTTKISMTTLGIKYNINRCTVSQINQGKAYPIKNYHYPARIIK